MYPNGATCFERDYFYNKKLTAPKKAPNISLPNRPGVGDYKKYIISKIYKE